MKRSPLFLPTIFCTFTLLTYSIQILIPFHIYHSTKESYEKKDDERPTAY